MLAWYNSFHWTKVWVSSHQLSTCNKFCWPLTFPSYMCDVSPWVNSPPGSSNRKFLWKVLVSLCNFKLKCLQWKHSRWTNKYCIVLPSMSMKFYNQWGILNRSFWTQMITVHNWSIIMQSFIMRNVIVQTDITYKDIETLAVKFFHQSDLHSMVRKWTARWQ